MPNLQYNKCLDDHFLRVTVPTASVLRKFYTGWSEWSRGDIDTVIKNFQYSDFFQS